MLERIKNDSSGTAEGDTSPLSWDERTGRVYINGRPTSISSSGGTILDYLQRKLSTTKKAKSQMPPGYDRFNTALKTIIKKGRSSPIASTSFAGKGGTVIARTVPENWLRY
jgi:hypothetical protein